MKWTQIKKEILGRHEHAFEHDPNEVRLVLGFGDGQRVPVVVREDKDAGVVVAQVASGTATQIITMLRAASSLGVPVVMLGDTMCVRAPIANDNIEQTLQAAARAALRVRRASIPVRTDLGAFAFAL